MCRFDGVFFALPYFGLAFARQVFFLYVVAAIDRNKFIVFAAQDGISSNTERCNKLKSQNSFIHSLERTTFHSREINFGVACNAIGSIPSAAFDLELLWISNSCKNHKKLCVRFFSVVFGIYQHHRMMKFIFSFGDCIFFTPPLFRLLFWFNTNFCTLLPSPPPPPSPPFVLGTWGKMCRRFQ